MRILVAIANHGTKNQRFLSVLLETYRSMEHDVDVVVLSDRPKDLGPDVEVRVGAPTDDPWSLPFAHRELFADRLDAYELFIYSEDDTHIQQHHIDAFLEVDRALPDDEVAGFQRFEVYPTGERSYCSIHSSYRWLPGSVGSASGEIFAGHTNLHSACYMLTREQLRRAISSGGFLVPPHADPFDMLVSAATDPYTQCGLRRRICVSRLDDFVIHHLPNVYLGKLGITEPELRAQVAALVRIDTGELSAETLVNPVANLPTHAWDVPQHPSPATELRDVVGGSVGRLLSVGCTSGAVERSLAGDDADVVAIPIDEVAAAVARTRDVRTLAPNLQQALASLEGRHFDVVLLHHVLHHWADPARLLTELRGLVSPEGHFLVTIPNARYQQLRRAARRKGVPALPTDDFEREGIHRPDVALLRRAGERAGVSWRIVGGHSPRVARYAELLPQASLRWLAHDLWAVGTLR